MTKKLDQLENQMERLKARLQLEKNRVNTKERKKETRRKILVGAYFMNQYEDRMDELVKLLDPFLTRDNDRELFNLSQRPQTDQNLTSQDKESKEPEKKKVAAV